MSEIAIKSLHALEDMRAVVALQRVYWGDEIESVIPAHMLFSLANHGGHVLTAFDADRAVGTLVGFLGTNIEETRRPAMANLQLVSKRMVVLPEYRGRSIGFRLKLAQRDLAMTQGIRLVVWTFDPLLAANAHLNIRKLGAICPQFRRDYYGASPEGHLTTLGSSDRFIVEWWVTNRRVEERLFGHRVDLTLSQYREADTVILNPTVVAADGSLLPSETIAEPVSSLALVEIPLDYKRMVLENPALAQRWRSHSRVVFERLFGQGFVATDFLRETYEGRERAFYVMSYNGPQFESFTIN
ncbi:MAG: GNAT family N-acetyltransferase [Aggregatilineales bacterium]